MVIGVESAIAMLLDRFPDVGLYYSLVTTMSKLFTDSRTWHCLCNHF